MDNTFALLDHDKKSALQFLDCLSMLKTLNDETELTLEMEDESKLPFLDTLVICENHRKFQHRKPTFTRLYILEPAGTATAPGPRPEYYISLTD